MKKVDYNPLIGDEFAEDKKEAWEKLFGEGSVRNYTFDLEKTTLESHESRKQWFCYICDRPIERYYYSLETHSMSEQFYLKRICPKCVSRIVDFFDIDVEYYEKLRHLYMKAVMNLQASK